MTKELKEHIEARYSECCKRAQGLSYGSFYDGYMECYKELEKENEGLRKTAEYQQTQNIERYFENERTRKTALLNLDGWRKSDAKLEKARALLAQWAQTSFAGACDNVNLAAETEQFLAGDLAGTVRKLKNGGGKMSDELLLLELERYRQMLTIASKDISKFINCKPSDYLHDLGTRDYFKEIEEK